MNPTSPAAQASHPGGAKEDVASLEPELDSEGRICSNATLVVCAVSLVGQWVEEARRKVADGALRIYQYHGSGRMRDIRRLATEFDVVVTTYSTLGADWARLIKAKGKAGEGGPDPAREVQLRRGGVSPLHDVHWHRLVMDESHTVKSPATLQTQACAAVEAARRWCCTATPMGNDVMDLLGQFAALRMAPFNDKTFFTEHFRHILHRDYGAAEDRALLLYVLSRCMVRHTKHQHTGGETVLQLPPLTREDVAVTLSPPEAELYRNTHSKVASAFHHYASRGAAYASKHFVQIMALLLPLRRIASGGALMSREITLHVRTPRPGRSFAAPQEVPGLEVPSSDEPGEDAAQCPICLDTLEAPVLTRCGHWFCHECILGAMGVGDAPKCPLCRAAVRYGPLHGLKTSEPNLPRHSAVSFCGQQ